MSNNLFFRQLQYIAKLLAMLEIAWSAMQTTILNQYLAKTGKERLAARLAGISPGHSL